MTNFQDQLPVIQSNIGGTETNAVDARKLHAALGVKKDFSNWVKAQIERAGFVERIDFVKIAEKSSSPKKASGIQGRIDYLFALSAAKEICMMAQTPKGKEVRLYFLDCERKLKEVMNAPALPNFMDPAEAAIAWAEQYRKTKALETKIKEDEPKVAFSDQVQASNVIMAKTEVAKLLDYPPRKFDDYIRQIKMLYASKNIAKQWAINSKLMVHRFFPIQHSDETIEQKPQPYFTTKGVFYVYKRMLAEGLIARNPKVELNFKS